MEKERNKWMGGEEVEEEEEVFNAVSGQCPLHPGAGGGAGWETPWTTPPALPGESSDFPDQLRDTGQLFKDNMIKIGAQQ